MLYYLGKIEILDDQPDLSRCRFESTDESDDDFVFSIPLELIDRDWLAETEIDTSGLTKNGGHYLEGKWYEIPPEIKNGDTIDKVYPEVDEKTVEKMVDEGIVEKMEEEASVSEDQEEEVAVEDSDLDEKSAAVEAMTIIPGKHPVDELVDYLKEHIISQDEATEFMSCAVYLKDCIDRIDDDDQRMNTRPANMLLIGPTGVGKTEIARRLAQKQDRPVVIFAVNKLSERGYVGGDTREIYDAIMASASRHCEKKNMTSSEKKEESADSLKEMLGIKKFKDADTSRIRPIVVERTPKDFGTSIQPPGGAPSMFVGVQGHISEIRTISFKELVPTLIRQKLHCEQTDASRGSEILEMAERTIVVLDELDKLIEAHPGGGHVSREGVQNELLTIIEGTTVDTRIGPLRTDCMLFIGAGAFSGENKPEKLIPELLGRLPVRVVLNSFDSPEPYRKILDTKYSSSNQMTWTLGIDNPDFKFEDEAKDVVAEYAFEVNKGSINTGARVLDTLIQSIVKYWLLKVRKGPITAEIAKKGLETSIYALKKEREKVIGFDQGAKDGTSPAPQAEKKEGSG